MSSQTHSSQGSNARGRGRQAAGRGFALTPTEPEEDSLLVEGAYKSPNEKGQRDCKKPKARSCPTSRSEVEILSSSNLKAFSFSELKSATNNFHPESLLGEGGFGFVYKGCIDADTLGAARPGSAMDVAVKKLIPAGFQGHKEWLAEVNFLGQLQHPNLVKLLGYCLEGEDRLLVYEFMARGSLENHLFRRTVPPLSWETRIKVAVGAARGLAVLHNSQPEIIYRDFKASNILLDLEFNAKLSDFGLAKEGPTGDRTHVSTQVFGTQGYAAPEYIATGHLTTRCDIYSFGVVLLEILSGRRAIDKTKPRAEEKLVSWAKPYLNDKKMFYRIMDSRMEGGYPKTGAYIASTLALQCVCHAKNRPTMSEVVKILERILAATDTAGPSQSAQQSAPSPVGRSTVGSSNPSPLPLSPAESPSPAHSPQPPQQLG